MLLEPVVRSRLVVEGIDLDVTAGAIQANGLGEPGAGFQMQHPYAALAGLLFEGGQQPPADAETADIG